MAWWFPPKINGGVYRPIALARHLEDLGWRPTVAAGPIPRSPNPAGSRLLQQVDASVAVHRFRQPRPRAFRRVFPRLDGGSVTMVEWVAQLRRWIPPGEAPRIIVATGPPFNSFVAARYLARAFGSKLVLDYRDEWTECPFWFVESGRLDRWYEHRCLAAADAVVFTTGAALDHQRATFEPARPIHWRVIPNGWEASDHVPHEPAPGPREGQTVRLCFAGELTRHTLPGPFLEAVEQVLLRKPEWRSRLRVRFVGLKHRQAREQLSAFPFPELLELVPLVPRLEAHRLMRLATALIVFDSPSFARYIPGKLYDYLACRRPILVFGRGHGEISRLVERLRAGTVIDGPSDLEGVLTELGAARDDRGVESPALESWLKDHTRRRMAERFADLFEELVD